MEFSFARNKYQKELLIDCFQKQGSFDIEVRSKPFKVAFYEIIVVTSGEGHFTLDDEEISLKKGTVLLLPPNKWREWNLSNENFEATYLIFEEESISAFFNDALYLYRLDYFHNVHTPSYLDLTEAELQKLSSRMEELQKELTDIRDDSMHYMRSILYNILIQLNREYKTTYQIEHDIYQKTEILNFKKLIETHISQKHKVKEYADLLRISTSHLNNLVQKNFGKSASQFIKERLVIEIKRKLLYSDKSISEISYELNFSEPSNFTRFFLSVEKQTPNEYRSQNDNS